MSCVKTPSASADQSRENQSEFKARSSFAGTVGRLRSVPALIVRPSPDASCEGNLAQRHARRDHPQRARAGGYGGDEFSGRRRRDADRIPGDGPCPGAHGLSRMRGDDGRSDGGDLCAARAADNNADTQQNITQYFATVPAADIDVALQAQAACLHGIDDSQEEWSQERGAIEQEVARDLSNPTYKFIDRLNQDMFAGTPYAHDPLGTKSSFDATTGEMLKDFYNKWYTPEQRNPGDRGRCRSRRNHGQGAAVVRRHRAATLCPRGRRSICSRSSRRHSRSTAISRTCWGSLPTVFREPTLRITRRARFCPMCWPASVPIFMEWFRQARRWRRNSEWRRPIPRPVLATAWWLCLPEQMRLRRHQGDAEHPGKLRAERRARGSGGRGHSQRGCSVPSFSGTPFPGLANVWSNALAAEGRNSPDEDIEAIKRVTLADVNRVAKQYLADQNSITATLKPVPTGQPVAGKGFGGAEEVTSAPTKPVQLPRMGGRCAGAAEGPRRTSSRSPTPNCPTEFA